MSRILAVLRSLAPFLAGLPVLLAAHALAPPDVAIILVNVGVNVILAVSLNVVNGFTGQFSLGHAGFMAVGAYTATKVTLALDDVVIAGLPVDASEAIVFFVALLLGMALAAVAGLLVGLPSLRLRGDYLAIVTLGFN